MAVDNKSNSSVVLVGGPDSGKSNFIFRLWHAINNESGVMSANGLPDHLQYLKDGCDSLLRGEFAQRTQQEVFSENSIPFRVATESGPVDGLIVVPDCDGERWMSVFRKREWAKQWEARVAERCGVLVFVRAGSDQISSPLDWIQCERLWGQPIGEGEAAELRTPTQVVLTDWLQFFGKAFSDHFGSDFRPRIGIVVTAWDAVPADRQASGPAKYISEEFPLLAQFIESNDDGFDFACFGVSIAGGDFKDEPGFKSRSLDQDDPLSGGYVVHHLNEENSRTSDMTLPVAWAMGLRPE